MNNNNDYKEFLRNRKLQRNRTTYNSRMAIWKYKTKIIQKQLKNRILDKQLQNMPKKTRMLRKKIWKSNNRLRKPKQNKNAQKNGNTLGARNLQKTI